MLLRESFRKRSNYALALASEVLGWPLRIYARHLAAGAATAPSQWRKGLILGESHIGDVLYNTASLAMLKRGLPKCEWHYLAELPAAQVLETNPNLAGVLKLGRPRGRDAAGVLQQLRDQHFDVAICYNSGMYWRDLLLVTKIGIPNRVGYVHKGFSGLVTYPIPIRYPQPFPAYFRNLVGEITGKHPTWDLRPLVYPTGEDEAAAENLVRELAPTRPRIACFVTTRQPGGAWPVECFGEALSIIQKTETVPIVLCGSAQDRPILEKLRADFGLRAEIMAGQLSLRALVVFLRAFDAVLSTDSGPRHLANAAGTPVVFVRNLLFSKVEAGVYSSSETDLAPPGAEYVCAEDQPGALRGVAPEAAAEAVRNAMARVTRPAAQKVAGP